jgi:hypothetical protein
MNPAWRRALPGVLMAIAATTALDAGGYSAFSALALLPLTGLFWYLERHSRTSMGFAWGRPGHYGLAVLYPVIVLGASVAFAAVMGAVDVTATDWTNAWRNFALVAGSTILVAIVTEEGFFRGWLFASLGRAGLAGRGVLIWSSAAFSLWHLSAVTLDTGFDLPAARIPVYLINAALLGGIWGMLRLISGSVVVTSVSHGLWNGGAYVLFGYGTKTGALGVENTAFHGPETGLLGVALNLAFAVALYQFGQTRRARVPRG